MRGRVAGALLAALLAAACTPSQGAGAAPSASFLASDTVAPAATTSTKVTPSAAQTALATAAPTAVAAPTATPTTATAPHVFVIVMENTGYARAMRSAPIAQLAAKYAVATNFHAVARPSLPNYLAMTSGSTWGVTDNGYHALPATGLGAQLTAAGISWRAYMEGMTAAGCMRSPYPYALKHNPFAYYGGCPANVVPFESFADDLAADTPSFVWITPGLCHDAHDCPIDEAGAWLTTVVSSIVSSNAWKQNGVLFIAWDEGDGGDANLVPLIVASPRLATAQINGAYDHYSLLATIEDLYGLPRLGAATNAASLLSALGPRR